MAQAITYVKDPERMITRARLTRRGIFVRFADDQEGLVPLEELKGLRGEAGQEALAAKSGISCVTIARLEAGEQDPHYGTLLAFLLRFSSRPAKSNGD